MEHLTVRPVNAAPLGGTGRSSSAIIVGTDLVPVRACPGQRQYRDVHFTGCADPHADATYAVELNSRDSSSDRMIVNGVTLKMPH